ncbi:MAG TPA: sulfotransferase domain-containing protein [Steroidobacteraceae bacterium]|nr:sulfotransferase domain-containing protein [Steroidobacteraceae bacterium]
MRTNDILVAAFPKSGITYFGFLLTAARLHHNGMALRPTMYNIDFLLIDSHKMAGQQPGSIWHDGIGDLYKTHDRFAKLPNVIYVLRDPVETLRSYYHFRRQLGTREGVGEFLAGPHGIDAWTAHVRSWLIDNRAAEQSVFVTLYESLVARPREELRALGAQLGLEFSPQSLDHAVATASLERMRVSEAAFVARNPVNARFTLEFVRPGGQRQVEGFTPPLIESINVRARPLYEEVRSRLGSPPAPLRPGVSG